MNDLDLRTALHRDADLVGAPSPDLLEQLGQRRQQQRRQRAGVLSAVAAVVVIAAGIPVGQSLFTRSESTTATDPIVTTSAPATPTAPALPTTTPVVPTPSATPTTEAAPAVTTQPAPSTAPVPTRAAATTEAPATPPPVAAPETAAPTAAAPSLVDVPCPGVATLQAAFPADTAEKLYEVFDETPVCSGTWAAAGYWEHSAASPDDPSANGRAWWTDGQAGLFQFVGGAWTQLARMDHCDDAGIPPVVWERACNVD